MSKRKGKTIGIAPGGKRMRENGRLKLQESDSDSVDEECREKILKDAGLDSETMKAISDTERQDIIKAIMQSNQAKEVVFVDSSETSDSKDSTSAQMSLNEEETQPPDGPSDVAGESSSEEVGSRSCSPKISVIDIPTEIRFEGRKPPQDTCEGGSRVNDESDNTKRAVSVEEELEEEEDKSNSALSEEATQPYQNDEGEPSSVLAVETQFFSPERKVKGKADILDVIPESPPSVSHVIVEEDKEVENDDDEEPYRETGCGLLNRIYPVNHTTNIFQDFLPRFSPGTVKNSSLYSQVIKSMFDIYLRRLQLAKNRMMTEPVKWGGPVKTGLHCESLLRRRTLVSDRTENKDGKTSGRGRRRIVRRNVRNDTDSLSTVDDDSVKNKICLHQKCLTTNDPEDSPSGDERPKGKCDKVTAHNIFNLDEDSSDDTSDKAISNKTFKISKSKLSTRSKIQKANESIATTSKLINTFDNEDGLSPLQADRHSPTPQMSYEHEIAIPPLEIEIIDDDSSSEPKSDLGSWLSAKNSSGQKNVSETKQGRKAKTRSDSPQVAKSILKRKGKKNIIGQRKISEVLVAENDLCQITEIVDEESAHTGKIGLGEEMEFETIQKNDKESSLSTKEIGLKDDLPSSVDSTYLLNSQGDMYSTQMTKIKLLDKKKKVEKLDSTFQIADNSSVSNFVVLSSGPRRKLRKDKSSSVEEIEVLREDDNKSQSDKPDVLDSLTESASTLCSDQISRSSRSSTRKRKLIPVEEIEIFDDPEHENDKNDRNGARTSVKKLVLDSENQPIEFKGTKSKTYSVRFDDVGENSGNFPKKGVNLNVGSDLDESCGSKIKVRGRPRKEKRKLFDESTYTFGGESETKDGSVNNLKPGKRVENNGKTTVDGDKEGSHLNADHQTLPQEERPSTSSSKDGQTKTVVKEGTCPICNKVFKLDELEAHASTCGEGSTEDEVSSTIECMICHKDIARDVLKEHQTECAASRIIEIQEETVPKRRTRAKNPPSNMNPRKNALLRDKSPSSSGEDYGELIIEVEKA